MKLGGSFLKGAGSFLASAGVTALTGNPGLGMAAGDIVGSLGPSDARLQRREDLYWYNKSKKDNIAFWNMQNEYNTPAAQAQRYLDAGMNPYLVQGTIGDAGNAGAVASTNPVNRKLSPRDKAVITFFQNKHMQSAENQNLTEELKNEYYRLKNIQLAEKIERDRNPKNAVVKGKRPTLGSDPIGYVNSYADEWNVADKIGNLLTFWYPRSKPGTDLNKQTQDVFQFMKEQSRRNSGQRFNPRLGSY